MRAYIIEYRVAHLFTIFFLTLQLLALSFFASLSLAILHPSSLTSVLVFSFLHDLGGVTFPWRLHVRYRKLARDVPQSPWIIDGVRKGRGSVDECLTHAVAAAFGVPLVPISTTHSAASTSTTTSTSSPAAVVAAESSMAATAVPQSLEEEDFDESRSPNASGLPNGSTTAANTAVECVKFHGAGREDIDVRMLGRGRPFILEVINPRTLKPLLQAAAAAETGAPSPSPSSTVPRLLPLPAVEAAVNAADGFNAQGDVEVRATSPRIRRRGEIERKCALSFFKILFLCVCAFLYPLRRSHSKRSNCVALGGSFALRAAVRLRRRSGWGRREDQDLPGGVLGVPPPHRSLRGAAAERDQGLGAGPANPPARAPPPHQHDSGQGTHDSSELGDAREACLSSSLLPRGLFKSMKVDFAFTSKFLNSPNFVKFTESPF